MVDGRKIAIAFGLVALLACAGFGGYRVYSHFVGAVADMKAVAEPSLTALAAQDWDAAALSAFATPALQEKLKASDIKAIFVPLRFLGKVKQFRGAQGFNETYQDGRWTAKMTENVQFDGGEADVLFTLNWRGGQWRLDDLNVTPRTKANGSPGTEQRAGLDGRPFAGTRIRTVLSA